MLPALKGTENEAVSSLPDPIGETFDVRILPYGLIVNKREGLEIELVKVEEIKERFLESKP